MEAAARYQGRPAERIEDWLFTHAVADPRFRSQLLRYVDILAALEHDPGGREAKRFAEEYFSAPLPGRTGLAPLV